MPKRETGRDREAETEREHKSMCVCVGVEFVSVGKGGRRNTGDNDVGNTPMRRDECWDIALLILNYEQPCNCVAHGDSFFN